MNIGKIIAELLFEYDTVVLPGLGGFSLQQHPVLLDQTRGIVRPASKQVSFNPNLRIDDGLLVGRLKQDFQIPHSTATTLVENYINDIREKIIAGESVTLEGVGSFYANGESIHFSPVNINYNTDSYGLSEVEAKAIRQEDAAPVFESFAVAAPVAEATTSTKEKSLSWLVGLAAAALVAVLILSFGDQLNLSKRSLKDDIDKRPSVNTSPSDPAAIAIDQDTADDLDASDSDIESPTPVPGKQVKKVVVGAFGERANAEKVARKIQRAGYTPFSEMRNNKRYVGIAYAYNKESEFQEAFADIKKKFGNGAWVLTD
ncbi:MAG: SPOR domain-containing protein [Bacteroidota bacterium]